MERSNTKYCDNFDIFLVFKFLSLRAAINQSPPNNKIFSIFKRYLCHFKQLFHFYTPWKLQKTCGLTLIKLPPVVFPKIWFLETGWHLYWKYEDFLLQSLLFWSIFRSFWHFVITKKVMTPNKTDDVSIFYFEPTLNRLCSNCAKLYWY